MKIETSKAILLVSYIVGITLTIVVIIGTVLGYDMGYVTQLAAAAWLEISASNIFYYTMCKRLNVPKIVMYIYNDLPDEVKSQVDINTLLCSLMN